MILIWCLKKLLNEKMVKCSVVKIEKSKGKKLNDKNSKEKSINNKKCN